MAKRNFKRLMVVSDFHCGHEQGLTPPDWWYVFPNEGSRQKKVATVQRELWEFYTKNIDELKPIDYLIVNGDLVDGKGGRSGSTEQRTADRAEQAEMAAACINYVGAPKVLIIFGTPYHAGMEEDWEREVVPHIKDAEVKIAGQDFPIINGVQFDVKHFVAGSSIPHGQATPLMKDKLWNEIWHNEHELQPKAEILIRSHIHYHIACSKYGWTALTTPMMMGFGDKFGVRKMARLAEVGFVKIDIDNNGDYRWKLIKAILPSMKAQSYVW